MATISSRHSYWVLARMAGILGFVLFIGVAVGFGQGVRITDADVDLSNVPSTAQVTEGKVPAKVAEGPKRALRTGDGGLLGRGSVLSRGSRIRSGVQLTSYNGGVGKPSVLGDAVYRETARYGIDPELVFSLIWQESKGKLGAVSPKGARGPMQMLPETALRFGARNPHDPDQAVRAGVAYLVWLLDRFGGNVSLALAAYNSGEGAVDAYSTGRTIVLKNGRIINRRGAITKNGIPPYNETENYVKRIADRYRMIKNLPR